MSFSELCVARSGETRHGIVGHGGERLTTMENNMSTINELGNTVASLHDRLLKSRVNAVANKEEILMAASQFTNMIETEFDRIIAEIDAAIGFDAVPMKQAAE